MSEGNRIGSAVSLHWMALELLNDYEAVGYLGYENTISQVLDTFFWLGKLQMLRIEYFPVLIVKIGKHQQDEAELL